MSATWPTTKISVELYKQHPYKRQVRSEMENGTVQSRAGATRSRMIFSVGWKAISESEYVNLQEHFETYVGNTFSFTSPLGTTYTVRYSEDQLPEGECVSPNESSSNRKWAISGIALEEA